MFYEKFIWDFIGINSEQTLVINFFETIRKELIQGRDEKKQYLFNYVPFGVGHLQYRKYFQGAFFLFTELFTIDTILDQPLIVHSGFPKYPKRVTEIAAVTLYQLIVWEIYDAVTTQAESDYVKAKNDGLFKVYNYLPMGVGQFKNQNYVLGVLFFGAQAFFLDQTIHSDSAYLPNAVNIVALGVSVIGGIVQASLESSGQANKSMVDKTSARFFPFVQNNSMGIMAQMRF